MKFITSSLYRWLLIYHVFTIIYGNCYINTENCKFYNLMKILLTQTRVNT